MEKCVSIYNVQWNKIVLPRAKQEKVLSLLGRSQSLFINERWTNGKGDFQISYLEGDLLHFSNHCYCLKVAPAGCVCCNPYQLYTTSQTQNNSCLYHLASQNQPQKLLLLSLALWDIEHMLRRISVSLAEADIVPTGIPVRCCRGTLVLVWTTRVPGVSWANSHSAVLPHNPWPMILYTELLDRNP